MPIDDNTLMLAALAAGLYLFTRIEKAAGAGVAAVGGVFEAAGAGVAGVGQAIGTGVGIGTGIVTAPFGAGSENWQTFREQWRSMQSASESQSQQITGYQDLIASMQQEFQEQQQRTQDIAVHQQERGPPPAGFVFAQTDAGIGLLPGAGLGLAPVSPEEYAQGVFRFTGEAVRQQAAPVEQGPEGSTGPYWVNPRTGGFLAPYIPGETPQSVLAFREQDLFPAFRNP